MHVYYYYLAQLSIPNVFVLLTSLLLLILNINYSFDKGISTMGQALFQVLRIE